MSRKTKLITIILSVFLLFSLAFSLNYYREFYNLRNLVESKLEDDLRRKDLYERIILQYEKMEFKIFAFEKKYPEFAQIVQRSFKEAKKHRISPYAVLSVIQVESNFEPNARSGIADGLMQINVPAWKEYFKIDEKKIYDIDYNITLGCKILKHYLDISGGDLSKALYLYNNGYGFNNKKYVPKVNSSIFFNKR